MAHQNYAPFLDRLINKYEGGYGWDKSDPGGPTKYGITCYDLALHRNQKMTSMATWAPLVEAMTLAEAEDIYWTRYAVPLRFNDLPSGVDCCILDYGVNSGVGRVLSVASALAKVPGVSGTTMDPRLLTAITKMDRSGFVSSMCTERLSFMHAIKGGAMWATYGRGWGARVADLKAYCAHLIAEKVAPEGAPVPDHGKAVIKSNSGSTTTAAVATAAGAGVAAAGMGLSHWAIGIAVGVVLVVALAYGLYEALLDEKASGITTSTKPGG